MKLKVKIVIPRPDVPIAHFTVLCLATYPLCDSEPIVNLSWYKAFCSPYANHVVLMLSRFWVSAFNVKSWKARGKRISSPSSVPLKAQSTKHATEKWVFVVLKNLTSWHDVLNRGTANITQESMKLINRSQWQHHIIVKYLWYLSQGMIDGLLGAWGAGNSGVRFGRFGFLNNSPAARDLQTFLVVFHLLSWIYCPGSSIEIFFYWLNKHHFLFENKSVIFFQSDRNIKFTLIYITLCATLVFVHSWRLWKCYKYFPQQTVQRILSKK